MVEEIIDPKVFRKPTDIANLVFHTNRALGDDYSGEIHAWVYKPHCEDGGRYDGVKVGKKITCPFCGEEEFKKASARSKDLKCLACKKKAPGLACNICGKFITIDGDHFDIQLDYTCPHCKEKGQDVLPWVRTKGKDKKFKWSCKNCSKPLILQKLK